MISAHNFIVGTPYSDIGGDSYVRLIGRPDLKCKLTWTKRGWITKEMFKVEGVVTSNNKNLYKIDGNWNSRIFVTAYN